MNVGSLSGRLDDLSDSLKVTSQLIQRLSKLSFQPGSTPLETSEGDVRVELSADIHQSLKEQEEELEFLTQELDEYSGLTRAGQSGKEREHVRLAAQLARLAEDLKIARTQFRKAQLQAKRNAEAAKRKERELLFAGVQEGRQSPVGGHRRGQEKLSQDDLIVNASTDVTAALRRTHQLMQTELSRSQFAHETLEQSTAALATLSQSYSTLDTLLSSSRSLLTSLLRSQKSDTWYLETSFYILLSTIIWLIFRRFFYGPLWWFLWLPLKLLFNSISAVFGALSLAVGRTGESATPSRSLIVKPSATGGLPTFKMSGQQAPYIPVGAGGGKVQASSRDTEEQSRHATLSEQIGQMAEAGRGQTGKDKPSDPPGPSDTGAATEQQGAKARNPKKRMWEEDIERQKFEQGRKDEL